ncbi:ATP-grasp domain-containing protein [Actinocorallia sp. A-T 12471]|uniref:ATP-grasp domain-containing protein n=1 Tax=Actinocorallia sp. A-T 12471 TaxID=3089813 RepID=UPI0029CCCAB9|nr:ATP-grasp domain-containing protein [Actinocorallia sp. A-T 12471]MDX6741639.1 ATP-grasp domain-containing protein [Actinocorallia sp. A-T 12471]
MNTLLLVGANDDAVVKAKDLGLTVLLLQYPGKLTDVQEALADVVRIVDYTSWEETAPVVAALHAAPGFTVAHSLTEPGLENAARVNDRYGLGGTPHAVTRLLRDKLAMRRHLLARDPDAVAAAPLNSRADLAAFGERHGHPFIVKPVDATASIAVHRVDSPADADRVWAEVAALRGTRTDRVSDMYTLTDFLIEEYVDGPEFSVETFSFAGRHVVVAVTEKFVADGCFAEIGHALPARIGPADDAAIRAAVARFLDHVGFADGVTHTELRLSARGPVVIESHDRIAGDAIAELVRGAYGIDLTTYAFGWPFGLVPELPDRPEPRAGAAVRAIVAGHGTVASISGAAATRALPEVLDLRLTATPGAPTRPLRDNWDRLGLVAVTGHDTDAAIRAGERIVAEVLDVRVTTPSGDTVRAQAAPVGRAGAPV